MRSKLMAKNGRPLIEPDFDGPDDPLLRYDPETIDRSAINAALKREFASKSLPSRTHIIVCRLAATLYNRQRRGRRHA